MSDMKTITAAQLAEQSTKGSVDLIDVRTPMEFDRLHAAIARNLPMGSSELKSYVQARGDSDRPLFVICESGSRAAKVCEQLREDGLDHAVLVEGGTQAWEQADLPVVQSSRKVMSLERQVRIAAGTLVLVGVILSLTVHIAFIALSGFVGAGLVFAGLTDTCGMALMLARMPWNRPKNKPAACSAQNVKQSRPA